MLADLCRGVRSCRKLLALKLGLSEEEGRELFFGTLVFEVAHVAGIRLPWAAPIQEPLPEVWRIAQGCADSIVREPTFLGWCYQVWSEEGRAAASWGVSRAGSVEPGEFDPAATQLYTEEYMTDFLMERSLDLLQQSKDRVSVLDPACGSGHFLVQAVRSCARRFGIDEALRFALEDLCGADVDPFAVRLARICVTLELARLGLPRYADSIHAALEQAIVCVDPPFGTLGAIGNITSRSKPFSIVATNPPYLGRRKLNTQLRDFLDEQYPDAAHDLCAAFMVRCIELCAPGGVVSLVTSDKWLRLAGYKALRSGGLKFNGVLNTLTLNAVVELGSRAFNPEFELHDGVGVLLMCGQRSAPESNHRFEYVDATLCSSRDDKIMYLDEARAKGGRKVLQRQLKSDGALALLTGSFGWSSALSSKARRVQDVADVVVGLQTNDDARFCRPQWLVPPEDSEWRIHHKGGGYMRWYGSNRMLLSMSAGYDAFGLSERAAQGFDAWFAKSGWTYGWFANGSLGLRIKEPGWSFGRAASSALFTDDVRVVAFLNSRIASLAARRLGGKVQLPEGIVRALPVPLPESLEAIDAGLVHLAVKLRKLIVACDPLDASFCPGQLLSVEALLAVEALLLLVEGRLDAQSIVAAGYDDTERRELNMVLEPPVAALPFDLDVDIEAVRYIDELLPEDLRGMVSSLVDTVPADPKARVTAALPVTGPMERWSRDRRQHPVSVLRDFSERVAWSHEELSALHRERVHLLVVLAALEECGHTWRGEGTPVSQRARHSAPLPRVVERAETLLAGHGYKDFSQVNKGSLVDWVRGKLLDHEAQIFGWDGQSLLSKKSGAGRFVHTFSNGVPSQLNLAF